MPKYKPVTEGVFSRASSAWLGGSDDVIPRI